MKEREKYLAVLDLPLTAKMSDIRAAYRDLVKVWHPDRFTHDPKVQYKAQEKLKMINQAYSWLVEHQDDQSDEESDAEKSTAKQPEVKQEEPKGPTGSTPHVENRSPGVKGLGCLIPCIFFWYIAISEYSEHKYGQTEITTAFTIAIVSSVIAMLFIGFVNTRRQG